MKIFIRSQPNGFKSDEAIYATLITGVKIHHKANFTSFKVPRVWTDLHLPLGILDLLLQPLGLFFPGIRAGLHLLDLLLQSSGTRNNQWC